MLKLIITIIAIENRGNSCTINMSEVDGAVAAKRVHHITSFHGTHVRIIPSNFSQYEIALIKVVQVFVLYQIIKILSSFLTKKYKIFPFTLKRFRTGNCIATMRFLALRSGNSN